MNTTEELIALAEDHDRWVPPINGLEDAKEIINNQPSGIVVIDFWAPWCNPCKSIAPFIYEKAKEYSGDVRFFKVNIEEFRDVAQEYRVKSIPLLAFFYNGKMVNVLVGTENIFDQMIPIVKKLLSQQFHEREQNKPTLSSMYDVLEETKANVSQSKVDPIDEKDEIVRSLSSPHVFFINGRSFNIFGKRISISVYQHPRGKKEKIINMSLSPKLRLNIKSKFKILSGTTFVFNFGKKQFILRLPFRLFPERNKNLIVAGEEIPYNPRIVLSNMLQKD